MAITVQDLLQFMAFNQIPLNTKLYIHNLDFEAGLEVTQLAYENRDIQNPNLEQDITQFGMGDADMANRVGFQFYNGGHFYGEDEPAFVLLGE